MIHEVVPGGLDAERIDRVVALLTGASRAEASSLVEAGAVLVNGKPAAKPSVRVQEGDVVDVTIAEATAGTGPAADGEVAFRVVYADDDLVVVDKPAGLVVHPGSGNAEGTLVNGLLARYPEIAGVGDADRPGIVHRLDKGTSGLLVVARTDDARRALVAQLQARTVVRRYRALVWGHLESTSGVVDAPIGRSSREPTRMTVSAAGREARTRYEVVAQLHDPVEVAELQCRLETGRTHQIRVHLAAIGHPVVGDARYGGQRDSLVAPRPFLHAEHLELRHPSTGEVLAFDSPLPADLAAVRQGLR